MEQQSLEELCEAVIAQAAKDYRTALGGDKVDDSPPKLVISECERFFRSNWYSLMTNLDGEVIIEKIRKEFEGKD